MNTLMASQQLVANRDDVFSGWLTFDKSNRRLTWVLASLALMSAMSLVYLKDLNRRLFIDYQNLQAQHAQAYTDWSKLLLEQSAWSTQGRVQKIAQEQLNMQLPQPNQIVMVKM